jgi:hypothetical protein
MGEEQSPVHSLSTSFRGSPMTMTITLQAVDLAIHVVTADEARE